MEKKIVGLGNALADILTRIGSDAILGELGFGRGSMNLVGRDTHDRIAALTEGLHRTVIPGGSAANTVRGLARLGAECSYIGKIGADPVGEFMEGHMAGLGVVPQLLRSSVPTGQCMVLISPDGERTMATFLGAAIRLTGGEITPDMLTPYDILHIEGYLVQNHGLIREAVRKARVSGLTVSLDMASYNVVEENLDFLRELAAEYVDLLFANKEEARAFTGLEPEEAVREIGRHCGIAVVKMGEKGSLICSSGEVIEIAAVPAEVVDTTGAGDLYASGFLYGISRGLPLRRCGEIGSLVAAKTVETIGPALTEERMEEIRRQLDLRQ